MLMNTDTLVVYVVGAGQSSLTVTAWPLLATFQCRSSKESRTSIKKEHMFHNRWPMSHTLPNIRAAQEEDAERIATYCVT